MAMLYDRIQVTRQFPKTLMDAGQRLADNHAVSEVTVGDSGATLTSTVKDEQGQEEKVFITIRPWMQPQFDCECSCEREEGCEHVVATLLYNLALGSESARPPGRLTAQARRGQRRQRDTRQLHYILSVDTRLQKPKLILALQLTEPDGEGGVRSSQPYVLQQRIFHRPPRFLRYDDVAVFKMLLDLYPPLENQSRLDLLPLKSLKCLEDMALTGRCFLDDGATAQKAIPLQWLEGVTARGEWITFRSGVQKLKLVCKRPNVRVVSGVRPFFIDTATGHIGPVNTGLDKNILAGIDRGVGVLPEEAEGFIETYQPALDKNGLPLPAIYPVEVVEASDTRPQLTFYSKRTYSISLGGYQKPVIVDGMRMVFQYEAPIGSVGFPAGDSASERRQFLDSVVYIIKRNRALEGDKIEQLKRLVPELSPLDAGDYVDLHLSLSSLEFTLPSKAAWKRFFLELFPLLREQGWQARYESDFRYHFVSAEQWYGKVEQSKPDWLGLELGIQIDGESVNFLPVLVKAIEKSPEFFARENLKRLSDNRLIAITLDDGRIVEMDVARLRALTGVLIELYGQPKWDTGGRLKLNATQVSRLGELQLAMETEAGAATQWRGNLEILGNALKFSEIHRPVPVRLPRWFGATLRDYQRTGVSWLQCLREQGVAGILADDMGLGKTVQTLAHLAIEKDEGRLTKPALVVVPTSLLSNWVEEANRFAPELGVQVLYGRDRFDYLEQLSQVDLIITTYTLVQKDFQFWSTQDLQFLILDEAHNIKNSRTKVARSVKRMNADYRLCLTGTPLENHLGELWSLFDFLMPGFLESETVFKRLYRNPIEKEGVTEIAKALFKRVSPFMLRRTKNEVAAELPPKTEVVVKIPLTDQQQDLYETLRLASNQKIQDAVAEAGIENSRIMVLAALLKLRQVCCDPRLIKFEKALDVNSAKLQHLLEMVVELVDEGRRILVFSQFTSMLALIEDALTGLGVPYVMLTGATQKRGDVVRRFQSGEVPVFLISLKAGGVGLNLTAADTVIHYDPWWNPAAEQQATDRAYRIGQDKPVFVYKLLAENTVEERIFDLQQQKLALTGAVYDAAEQSSEQFALDNEALAGLLE